MAIRNISGEPLTFDISLILSSQKDDVIVFSSVKPGSTGYSYEDIEIVIKAIFALGRNDNLINLPISLSQGDTVTGNIMFMLSEKYINKLKPYRTLDPLDSPNINRAMLGFVDIFSQEQLVNPVEIPLYYYGNR